MALRFIDGFDHYATADILKKWDSSLNATIVASNARTGTQRLNIDNNSGFLQKNLDSQSTWIIGFGHRRATQADDPIVMILDGATWQVKLETNAFGGIRVHCDGINYTTPNNVIAANTWQYIEIKITVHNTTGSFELYVDGVSIMSETNIDTQMTANATADVVRFSVGNINDMFIDDVYICDGTGSKNNDFLGVVKIDTLYPDGNGNSSDFVGQDADSTDNYQNVDELLADGDVTYNESATATDRDDYTYDAMNITPVEIFGVAVNAQAKKSDAGSRSLDMYTRISVTDYDAAIDQALAEGYLNYQAIWENNPADAAAWEVADVDGAGFGIEVAS